MKKNTLKQAGTRDRLLATFASKNSSRLATAQGADEHVDELLEGLNGTFLHLRHKGIDEEGVRSDVGKTI